MSDTNDRRWRKEDPQYRLSRGTLWATRWMAIFTLALTLATIFLYLSGEHAVKVASQSLIASNRPWVNLSVVPGPLTYDINGANFLMTLKVENIGHAPAINAFIEPQIWLPGSVVNSDWRFGNSKSGRGGQEDKFRRARIFRIPQ